MGAFAEGALIHQFTSTATAGGTTALTVSSTTWQRFTGTNTETVTLPDATTMRRGREFVIDNRSTGAITVNFSGSTLAAEIAPGTSRTYRLFGNGAAAGDWAISNQVDVDGPLALFATRAANDSLLNIGANQITGSDGTTKSTPPSDDTIQSFVASTIDFQTTSATAGTTGGTFTTEAGTFTRPAIALGQFTRMVMVYQSGNNAIDTKFAPSAASQGALEDAGSLFSSLDGTPIGFIDLESTGASNFNFKTPGAATDIIENLGLTTFASGAGGGAGGDESFKLQSISSNVGTIKKGYILLSDGRELATYDGVDTNVALAFDLKSAVNTAGVTAPSASTTYYLYLDLNAIPGSSITDGDSDRVVYGAQSGTSGMFIVLATTPEFTNLSRYIPLASMKTDGSSDYTNFADMNGRKHTLPTSLAAANIESSVRDQLLGGTYELASPVIFSVDAETCVDAGTSTGEYTGSYDLDASEIMATSNLLDSEVLDAPVKISELDLSVYWGTAPTTATTYEVSRNGGNEYQTITMTEVGGTGTYYGSHNFTDEAAEVSILTQASKDTDTALNSTTQQSVGQSFTTTDPVVMTSVDLDIIKTGLPVGNVYAAIYTDNAGDPGILLGESQAQSIAGLSTGTENFTFPEIVLDDATYHFVLRTDAEYKGVFSSGVTEIKIENASSATSGLSVNDGAAWSAVATSALKYELKGQPLDVRVKITANAGEPATIKMDALSIFYVPEAQGSVNGTAFCQTFSFDSLDNDNSFTLTWTPDPKLLSVYYKETGQVFREGAYSISGQTILFPVNTFDNGGISTTVTLEFIQLEGSSFDNSDSNANSIATINNNVDALATKTALSDQTISEYMTATTVTGAPADGKFYSEITGRAPLIDPRESVSSKLGVERILTTTVSELAGESGPVGEPVYEADTSRIRFYGDTEGTVTTTSGKRISSQTGVSGAEITFYGTGLNYLSSFVNTVERGASVKVDGIASTSLSVIGDDILADRNYAPYSIINIVSGLTLGVHTVSLAFDGTGVNYTAGFEILNETVTVQQTAGTVINGAKKYTLADATDDLTTFTNTTQDGTGDTTKGGHVVWYLDTDGVRKKDIRYSDTDQKDLALADHSNEELVRTFNWREFGAGRADDFGAVDGSLGDHAFTLDDGTTTLVGDNVRTEVAISAVPSLEFITGSFVSLTFVGTGLDVTVAEEVAGSLTIEATVDGSSIGTGLNASSSNKFERKSVVSGLPFGAHTVKFEITAGGNAFGLGDFIIYAPEKPTLADGQTELASSYKMADFVANTTSGSDTIAQGIIRKDNSREFAYTGTTSAQTGPGLIGGFETFTAINGATYSYTFFGTGVDLRVQYSTNGSASILVELDDGSGFQSATVANFPSLITGSHGVNSFSSGIIDADLGSQVDGTGVLLSQLPLGFYTVRLTNQTTDVLRAGSADVITPYYNYTADVYDVSNDIIGSNTLKSEIIYPGTFKEPITALGGVDQGMPVAANYHLGAAQTIVSNTTPVNFGKKIFDTHGSVHVGTGWKFIAPRDGIYHVTANAAFNSINTPTDVQIMQVYIRKNGSTVGSGGLRSSGWGYSNSYPTTTTSDLVQLSKGDYIDVIIFYNLNGSRVLAAGPNNTIQIHEVR